MLTTNHIFGTSVQHVKKMDPIGSKILWKWGVKKIENQWKRGTIRSKIMGKLIQNALNLLNNTFWWNVRPTFGPSISGWDKPIFLQKEGVNRIVLMYKIGTQSDWKSPKRGWSPRNLHIMPKYGSTSPLWCKCEYFGVKNQHVIRISASEYICTTPAWWYHVRCQGVNYV